MRPDKYRSIAIVTDRASSSSTPLYFKIIGVYKRIFLAWSKKNGQKYHAVRFFLMEVWNKYLDKWNRKKRWKIWPTRFKENFSQSRSTPSSGFFKGIGRYRLCLKREQNPALKLLSTSPKIALCWWDWLPDAAESVIEEILLVKLWQFSIIEVLTLETSSEISPRRGCLISKICSSLSVSSFKMKTGVVNNFHGSSVQPQSSTDIAEPSVCENRRKAGAFFESEQDVGAGRWCLRKRRDGLKKRGDG